MIHPKTALKWVNDSIGLGVFAAALIPAGTIVYVLDVLDIRIKSDDPRLMDPLFRESIEKYSYRDENGTRIICWDHGKYVNHCCNSNTLTTGFGFEIAIRDILPGEEITDDYGLLNVEEEMTLQCGAAGCRGVLRLSDMDRYHQKWDELIRIALGLAGSVEQPLLAYMEPDVRNKLEDYLKTGNYYRSAGSLKYNGT